MKLDGFQYEIDDYLLKPRSNEKPKPILLPALSPPLFPLQI